MCAGLLRVGQQLSDALCALAEIEWRQVLEAV
jgi:hypothetical protein